MTNYEYVLKKYNITVRRQFFIEIPNMGRDDLAKLFGELNLNTGAEIGVDRGDYSEVLCKANSKLHLYSIDPWASYVYPSGLSGVNEQQAYFDGCYEKTKERLAPYNCTIVRKTSLEAAKDFPDNYFDFVYIDANHDFVNITNDLDTWKKKVKVDGILAGHDYAYFSYRKFNHVKRVLEVYARCYRMHPYFVPGLSVCGNGLIRDKYRSWFWVKK